MDSLLVPQNVKLASSTQCTIIFSLDQVEHKLNSGIDLTSTHFLYLPLTAWNHLTTFLLRESQHDPENI